MKLNKSQVIDKYRSYGFEYQKNYSNPSYLTFTFRSGFFHNAEIIQLESNEEDKKQIDQVLKDLNKLGISPKITRHFNLKSIEDELFNGFFDVDNWRNRIIDEYSGYVEVVTESFPSEDGDINYSYIDSPYEIANEKVDSLLPSIIDDVVGRLKSDKAELILVEAPAGFGKTSTSYEIIKALASDENMPIPFFTEFSRDRQARIFSHVFVREVDRAFTQVKSKVVEDELKNGRIALVLDGFDELLSDTNQNTSAEDDYENAEPMLETISELLSGKAKIIITSRKSAIFDGATFSEWIDNYKGQFKFTRYRISSPDVNNWLSADRRECLEKAGVDLKKLSNPVLLSYLKFLSEKSFHEQCQRPNEIIDIYFKKMFERERDRQNLLMSPEAQKSILTDLAADMCDKNYTSESKEKIINFFKANCHQMLEETRRLYKSADRPSLDSLCNTLSNHAFFDRSNQGEDRIEFVNEFVLGNFIAADILRVGENWIASDERFVDPAIISYEPRHPDEKKKLWNNLIGMRPYLKDSDRMKFEAMMLDEIESNSYNQTSIISTSLSELILFDNFNVSEITFTDCIFHDVIFYPENINEITFISCKFYNCDINDDSSISGFLFYNCYSNNSFIDLFSNQNEVEIQIEKDDQITQIILNKFWKVGSVSIERAHIPLSSIYKALQNQGFDKRSITLEIKKLKSLNLLIDAADSKYIGINTQKISDIKEILGK